jgi:hypothetical protein
VVSLFSAHISIISVAKVPHMLGGRTAVTSRPVLHLPGYNFCASISDTAFLTAYFELLLNCCLVSSISSLSSHFLARIRKSFVIVLVCKVSRKDVSKSSVTLYLFKYTLKHIFEKIFCNYSAKYVEFLTRKRRP